MCYINVRSFQGGNEKMINLSVFFPVFEDRDTIPAAGYQKNHERKRECRRNQAPRVTQFTMAWQKTD